MNLIDRLKELDANRNIDCDAEERFRNALDDAWPKLLAVVEAAKGHIDGLIKGELEGSKKHLAAIIDALESLNQES